MSRRARRYWASLTDFHPETLDHLIEHGRRRDLPLWRRYIASLLDIEVIGYRAGTVDAEAGAAVSDQQRASRDRPPPAVHHTLDSTVHIGATAAARRSGGRPLVAFAVAVAFGLLFAASISSSLLTSGSGGQDAAPGTSYVPTDAGLPPPDAELPPTDAEVPPPTDAGLPPPTADPFPLPSGVHAEAGMFAWATPPGWLREVRTPTEVHYVSPDGKQELAGKAAPAQGDLTKKWRASERNAKEGEGYRRIRLEPTTFHGAPAVVWEYAFTLDGAPWHARLLGFTVDGNAYQINTWYRSEIEARATRTYEEVRTSFTVL